MGRILRRFKRVSLDPDVKDTGRGKGKLRPQKKRSKKTLRSS